LSRCLSQEEDQVDRLERVGPVLRAKADHRIKAAEAARRASLVSRIEAHKTASPTLIERLRTLLRPR